MTVESFITKYKNKVPETFLAKFTISIKKIKGAKSFQLSISMAWILLFISLITFMTVCQLPNGANFLLFTATLNVFFIQSFSHIGQTIIFRSYTPGVITALFIVIPYSFLSYYRLFELGLIDGHLLFKSIPLSILMVPIFLIGNLLGRKLLR
ncbi:HXXEE domain-containing protein [Paenibacillus sp. BSR1-1]|uniref:HXXEE domain-containing protein n=1 Tax=Paenibacillus sp. BSR1-1 TaxID=3020845 RepID=UPI00339D6711